MIRNVIMVRLREGVTDAQVSEFLEAIAAVPFPGRRSYTGGRDLGLVPDTMDLVMVSDFDDEQAYRDWVADPRHREVSTQLLRPIAEQIVRGQFPV